MSDDTLYDKILTAGSEMFFIRMCENLEQQARPPRVPLNIAFNSFWLISFLDFVF